MIDADRYLRALINKRIDVAFTRRHFGLSISHGLFSSNSLDAGTASLLRLVERSVDLDAVESVLDVGCGTGALGLPVAAAANATLHATDRDALATWFTRCNAEDLGLDSVTATCSLGASEAAPNSYSLALSNLPAKAGDPVLKQITSGLARAAGGDGISGTVIVRPLYESMKAHLQSLGATVTHEKMSANHVAAIWTGGATARQIIPDEAESQLGPYIRERTEFEGPKQPYLAETVYGLPDFDSLSFRMDLLFDFMRGVRLGGTVVAYGVGQGHLPVGCAQCGASDLIMADRDALALAIASRNLGADTATIAIPTLASTADALPQHSAAWLIVNDDPIPGTLWVEEIRESANELLAVGGKLLVLSRSTASVRLEQSLGRSFRRVDAKKHRGCRVAMWRRIDIDGRS